jgi:hypothetical protein
MTLCKVWLVASCLSVHLCARAHTREERGDDEVVCGRAASLVKYRLLCRMEHADDAIMLHVARLGLVFQLLLRPQWLGRRAAALRLRMHPSRVCCFIALSL